MLGKGLESLIPSGGYKKPEENIIPQVHPQAPEWQATIRPESSQWANPLYQGEQSSPRYEAPQPPAQPVQQPVQPVHQNNYQPEHQSFQQPQAPVQQSAYSGGYQPFNNYSPKPETEYREPVSQPVMTPSVTESYNEPRPSQDHFYGNTAPEYRTPEIKPQAPAFPLPSEVMIEEKRDIVPSAISGYAPRGLSDDYSNKQDSVFQIEVERIFPNPHQPRRYFDEGALNDLASSIREFGIIQPLVVTKVIRETESGTDVTYQLIAGERRLMAARKVGLRTVPAIVKQVAMDRERLELAIIENIQRENLSPLEAARSYARLQDEFGLTQREIAIRMGKSRETIANTLRLLNLPSDIQQALEEGKINESHARLLLQITDQAKQREMLSSILHFKPSVRELKAKLRQEKGGNSGFGYANPELTSLQSRLEEVLGTRVQINDEGEKGKIMISYYSPEELNDLIKKLSGGAMY